MKVKNYRNHKIVITETVVPGDDGHYFSTFITFNNEEVGDTLTRGNQTDALRAAKRLIDRKFETPTL